MINDDIFLNNGYLDIQGLDAKINASFEGIKTAVNGFMDVAIVKSLLGAKLSVDYTGDVRQLLFLLIMIDKERTKDDEISGNVGTNPNSHYIELFNTEVLRDFYLCKLDNSLVNYLFSIFLLDYDNPAETELEGIGNMIIEGAEVPFKIY